MNKKLGRLGFAIALGLLIWSSASAQMTFSGQPTEDDYEFFCRNYGAKGTQPRNDCESLMRVRRGVGTCQDIIWTENCSVDSMTDDAQCTITTPGSNLFVFIARTGVSFNVSGDEYPGTRQQIKIDEQPVISFIEDTSPAQDKQIFGQLKNGTRVRTRFVKWPEQISVDSDAPICNLLDVIERAKVQAK